MGDGGGPRDAAFIEGLLQEMGVKEYDPLVVHQLLEVSYSEDGLQGVVVACSGKSAGCLMDILNCQARCLLMGSIVCA